MLARAKNVGGELGDQLAVARDLARLFEKLTREQPAGLGGQACAFAEAGLDLVAESSFECDDRELGPEIGGREDATGRKREVMLQHDCGEAFDAL